MSSSTTFCRFCKPYIKMKWRFFIEKFYVLLTRSRENLYILLPKKLDENLPDEIKQVIEIIKKYASITQDLPPKSEQIKEKSSLKLASIRPVLRDVKEVGELVVTGSQLFAIIAGLFA